jgi:hypothetical protein
VSAAGDDASLGTRIRQMAHAMDDLRTGAAQEEETLTLTVLLMPYLWRLAGVLLVTSVLAGWLARRVGARRPWTAGLVGSMASIVVILLAWLVTAPPWYPVFAPVVVFGTPWAVWRLIRRRSFHAALDAWRIWGASSLPGLLASGLLW